MFRQGVLVALFNPKVAVFFLAFLPQFVVPGAGPVPAQLFFHGILFIAVAGLVEPVLDLMLHRLMAGLRRKPSVGQWIDRALGTLLIGLGVKLFLSGKPE
ncbi:LysE family translocator [Jhaorihella thermophila]|uniref:LysE type translocator n=1 Tax=Jhaorihella thermophila TaxID=488547 RepID=A0A1H5VZA5_9RHOB|nr:LysE family transporter [Jhaorihella thermophila]SEF92306.1 LysE type translocator [Jhaorihella thermophila]